MDQRAEETKKVNRMLNCKHLIIDDAGTYCLEHKSFPIPKDGGYCEVCQYWEGRNVTSRRVKPKVWLTNKEEVRDALLQIGDFAGVCTGKEAASEKRGMACVDADHGSSQRGVHYKFRIEGVSIGFGREHLRHKIGVDHNEQSTRYVDLRSFPYVRPEGMENLFVTVQLPNERYISLNFDDLMDIIGQYYGGVVDGNNSKQQKIARDKARSVLPLAAETKVNSVFSFQALTHYMNKRLCSRAHEEIREIAKLMRKEIEAFDPSAARYFVAECQPESVGYCRQERSCGARPVKEIVIA